VFTRHRRAGCDVNVVAEGTAILGYTCTGINPREIEALITELLRFLDRSFTASEELIAPSRQVWLQELHENRSFSGIARLSSALIGGVYRVAVATDRTALRQVSGLIIRRLCDAYSVRFAVGVR
jgi:hypothetical protein